ncbi:hypothetical protein SAMN02745124_02667 [Desulfofustis glycolicus DSM 9705]|uniref:Uncharacterized protein n=1 Tax=Desulfofustis glycolicus DSM 9705 TaxID=1121409 RepID=A0A1M5X0S6_9BACT|nr:hypothetical protein SAMN02745124_02667 [Desulfofustis glycolicus DSM 9705]
MPMVVPSSMIVAVLFCVMIGMFVPMRVRSRFMRMVVSGICITMRVLVGMLKRMSMGMSVVMGMAMRFFTMFDKITLWARRVERRLHDG